MYKTDLDLLKHHFKIMFPMERQQAIIYSSQRYSYREGKVVQKALSMKNLFHAMQDTNVWSDENTGNFEVREYLQKSVRGVVKSIAESIRQEDLFMLDEDYYMDKFSCTVRQFREHFEKLFKDGMCWDSHGKWHIDHIKPCALFDLNDPAQQKKCFHFTNLQPLWAHENKEKRNLFKAVNADYFKTYNADEIEVLYYRLSKLCGEM